MGVPDKWFMSFDYICRSEGSNLNLRFRSFVVVAILKYRKNEKGGVNLGTLSVSDHWNLGIQWMIAVISSSANDLD